LPSEHSRVNVFSEYKFLIGKQQRKCLFHTMNLSVDLESGCSNGTVRVIDGRKRVYYDGYWIVHYDPPPETLAAKKNIIATLTRRAFHHTESGINTPGENLEFARYAYENASDPREKRVNAAMLAGALFNRATDIFTMIVDLESRGIHVSFENELMQQCNDCLEDAMELGKQVRHYSGMDGIDELWGEPLKAFTMPLSEFYVSRYVKISMGMRDIDRVASALLDCLNPLYAFQGVETRLTAFANAAKQECELIKSDPEIFKVWPRFIAAKETVEAYTPLMPANATSELEEHINLASGLFQEGCRLITYIAGARVPISHPTEDFLVRCERFYEQTRKLLGG